MDYITGSSDAAPLSIQEIAKKATDFEYNPLIPLRYWFRTADTLLKEANIYEREGNDQQAYLLLLRQAELVIKYLPNHPQANSSENIRHLRSMRQRLSEAMHRLEYLKPRIQARYQAYEAAMIDREARHMEAETGRPNRNSSSSAYLPYSYSRVQSLSQNRQSNQASVPRPLDLTLSRRGSASSPTGPFSPPLEREGATTPGTDGRNTELAMEIAKQEFARREKEKMARRSRQLSSGSKWRNHEVTKVSSPTTQGVKDKYGALKQQYTPSPGGSNGFGRDGSSDEFDLQKSIQELNIRDNIENRHESSRRDSSMPSKRDTAGSWIYEYPSVPKRSSAVQTPPLPQLPTFPPRKAVPPPLPGKPSYARNVNSPPIPPPPPPPNFPGSMLPPLVPRKTPLAMPSPPPSLPSLPTSLTSSPAGYNTFITPRILEKPQQTSRSSTYEFKTSARLESGDPLRTIFLPSNLRHKFLEIAEPNTSQNLETCGVLCGTLIQNALFISRLVIPEQEVTSDTCDMKDEEELFEYVNGEDLMVLGWIHTHPTYECFMSSVDLHNHCGYQLMLAESIAVVCAPRYEPSWGVFRLTDPPGVKTIMTCTQKGLFHPHSRADMLYTDAMRPGHVCVVEDMAFEVVDLRK